MEAPNPGVVSGRSPDTRVKPGLAGFLANPVFLSLLLAGATFVLYWPALGFNFINFDDPDYFSQNPHVQSGLDGNGVLWAFETKELNNWHPVTWLSLMFDVTMSGSGGPAAPHFTNLLFHAVNGVLLFLLLRRLTGAVWRSALVAALFALHPLNVESVAWISERKNVLSTCFWLLALLAYARYAQSSAGAASTEGAGLPRFFQRWFCNPHYILALLFFEVGLMCKPMLVTLPFVLWLLDYWPLGRWRPMAQGGHAARSRLLVLEKVPFLLFSALACGVTFLAQQQGDAVQSVARYSLSGRVENMFVAYCRYLGKAVWPENLTPVYPHPGQWPLATAVLAALGMIIPGVAVVCLGRRLPYLFTGWFWFLGTLIPVIGLVQVGHQSMADRYAYVPLIGIFIMISWGAAGICARIKLPGRVTALAAGLVLTACALRSRHQLSYWQNDDTFFSHAIALNPDYARGYLALGYYFENNGEWDEAVKNYRASIRIDPDNVIAHLNLGVVLQNGGHPEAAAGEYREAVRLAPQIPEVHYNLGCVLANLGRRDEAIGELRQALRLNPDYAPAREQLRALGVPPASRP